MPKTYQRDKFITNPASRLNFTFIKVRAFKQMVCYLGHSTIVGMKDTDNGHFVGLFSAHRKLKVYATYVKYQN